MRYLRIKIMYLALDVLAPITRKGRMTRFSEQLCPEPGTRIIDLGGTSEIWQFVRTPLDITIVNLPGVERHESVVSHHQFTFVDGDATCLSQYPDQSFDIAFCNSVIEHVGDPMHQAALAGEIRRLVPSYFVQTPSKWFPIEAHTGVPFWWFLPRSIRSRLHRRWEQTLPAWNEMVATTVVLERAAFTTHFLDGRCTVERVLGVPKSYEVVRIGPRRSPMPTVAVPTTVGTDTIGLPVEERVTVG